jgi:hypothetical protein
MRTVKVIFYLDVPDEATDPEIEAFVSYHVGATAYLDGENPMSGCDLEAKRGSVSVL